MDHGLIDVKYLRNHEYKVNGKQLLLVIVNGSHTLAYDTADNDQIYEEALSSCDLYFKRSYSASIHGKISKKILPLGLNYRVCGGNDGAAKRALWAFGEDGSSSIMAKAKDIIDSNRFLSRMFNDRNSGRNVLDISSFEGLPRYKKAPSVLFFTRPWDPVGTRSLSPDLIAERHHINDMRASCIRGLKIAFGKSFIGGFAPHKYAVEHYPDCIVDGRLTQKSEYLRAVRNAGICISTMGLRRSNGWKLAEYVANAKAIVTEKLHYEVPGDFVEGKNYLTFETADECVQAAVRLYENPEECYRMMCENYSYYHRYLRPDILVWNTLQKLMFESATFCSQRPYR